jgi:4-amino-4-deoxy-L-arabinose transferase-like glycosyltransferase
VNTIAVTAFRPQQPGVGRSTAAALVVVGIVYLHNTLPLLTTLPRINVDEPWLIERAYQLMMSGRPSQPMFLLDRAYLLQPGYSLLLGPWLKMFGVGLLQARVLAVCFGLGTLTSVFTIGSRLFTPAVGVLAAAFLATDSNFLGSVRFARTDAPAVCFAAASLAAFLIARDANRWPRYLASGMLAGLAMLCHANAYWAVAVAFLWCVMMFGRRLLLSAGPWAYAAGLLLTFGPYVYAIATNWQEFNAQLKIFAIERVPSVNWRVILAHVIAERSRYHDWYFGLITQTIPNPLLGFFQMCVAAGGAWLVIRLVRRPIAEEVGPERQTAVLAFGTAAVFAGFIPNKALIYMPHLLVGFSVLAAWALVTLWSAARHRRQPYATVGAAMWAILCVESIGGVWLYESWYASMRRTTALTPYETTEKTLRALVPPGRKYLFASPTFWLAFYDDPQVTFVADTAAGPYRGERDEGLFTRRSLYEFAQDRPVFALVDDEEWKTLLLDEAGMDRTWRTSWSAYLASSCALTSAAFGTAHGTLALYRCWNDRAPEAQSPWYLYAGNRVRVGQETWAAASGDLAGWRVYREGTVVAPVGDTVRISAEHGGGVFTDVAVRSGTLYLASFDVDRATVNDLASLHSVAPNGTLVASDWIKLARPKWFPGGGLVRARAQTLRIYLFSESRTNFLVRGVQLYEMREGESPSAISP